MNELDSVADIAADAGASPDMRKKVGEKRTKDLVLDHLDKRERRVRDFLEKYEDTVERILATVFEGEAQEEEDMHIFVVNELIFTILTGNANERASAIRQLSKIMGFEKQVVEYTPQEHLKQISKVFGLNVRSKRGKRGAG